MFLQNEVQRQVLQSGRTDSGAGISSSQFQARQARDSSGDPGADAGGGGGGVAQERDRRKSFESFGVDRTPQLQSKSSIRTAPAHQRHSSTKLFSSARRKRPPNLPAPVSAGILN